MFRYTETRVGKTTVTVIMDSLCSIKSKKGAIYFLIENSEDFQEES